MNRKRVVLGFLGTKLDRSRTQGPDRWSSWRPTVSLCQQEDFEVDRLVLLAEPRYRTLCQQICNDVASVSPGTVVDVREFPLDDPWDFEEVFDRLYRFATEFSFDTTQEDYLVHITTGTHVAQICWFLLAESRHIPARLMQTAPPRGRARDLGSYQLIDLDLSRYDRLAQRFAVEHQAGVSLLKSGIATRNEDFNRQIDLLERVALASADPILLTGPTGAGKSHLGSRVYELRRQRHKLEGPLVEINCATLRGDAAMSALFGHEKGAFTGAVSKRAGLLKTAHGGLLFLDEIGELGLDEQAMLLRALEEKKFLPVGADREVASEFQLITGTNCDLSQAVAQGRFREDLLARINLWTFRLPGLRERLEDLEPNLDYELDRYGQRVGRAVSFSREARARYLAFATGSEGVWRGNFRDLNASVTRLCTLATGGRITVDDVREEIGQLQMAWQTEVDPGSGGGDQEVLVPVLGEDAMRSLDRFDRVQLADVVCVCHESRSLSDAGRILFAASRERKQSTNDADRLRKYLAKFGLSFSSLREH